MSWLQRVAVIWVIYFPTIHKVEHLHFMHFFIFHSSYKHTHKDTTPSMWLDRQFLCNFLETDHSNLLQTLPENRKRGIVPLLVWWGHLIVKLLERFWVFERWLDKKIQNELHFYIPRMLWNVNICGGIKEDWIPRNKQARPKRRKSQSIIDRLILSKT